MLSKKTITDYFQKMQDKICIALENTDGKSKFSEDVWTREGGGGGRTRVIRNGNIIEKGGVNFSSVSGKCPEFILKEYSTDKFLPEEFFATGLSIVIHPVSPMVPIIHMNVRHFEISNLKSQISNLSWFGGGIDLTPHYINEDDARFFHQSLKKVCDRHDKKYYPEFKKWADDYFFIRHRNETRGIGGIFFDRLNPDLSPHGEGKTIEEIFGFVKSVAEIFLPVYLHLIEKNKNISYGEKEKQWQLLRRGRYVEFNLVYDKGTRFGLETGGRTESILMSLPQDASWFYNLAPLKNSHEEKTTLLLKKGIDWAS